MRRMALSGGRCRCVTRGRHPHRRLPVRFGGAWHPGLSLSEVLRFNCVSAVAVGAAFAGTSTHSNCTSLRNETTGRLQLVAEETTAGTSCSNRWNQTTRMAAADSTGMALPGLTERKICSLRAGHNPAPAGSTATTKGRRIIVRPKLGRSRRADISRWTRTECALPRTGASISWRAKSEADGESVGRGGRR